MREIQKYSTLFSLYIAQSIPMSFFSTVLPVILRMENVALDKIAYLQLLKIPWILKFIWSPLIDNNSTNISHYKKWIFSSELFYAAIIISASFFKLETSFTTIIGLMFIAFILSATQDIASDAFAIRILKKHERSIGNSTQSSGNFLGALFGSGILLVLYPIIGWQNITFLLGIIVLIALIPLYFYKPQDEVKVVKAKGNIKDFITFFKIKGSFKRMIFLIFFYSGILGLVAMIKPYMVDLGYTIQEIGFISGIYGTAIGAGCAFICGFILRKLGSKKTLYFLMTYNILAASFFSYLFLNPTIIAIYIAVTLIWSAYAMSSVLVYTVAMNLVRKGKEGTDYSFQIVFSHLGGILFVIICGKLAKIWGYQTMFIIEALLAITVFIGFHFMYKKQREI